MSEAGDASPAPPSSPPTEDERRQKAAEVNRKRVEDQWLRNKQRWIESNFPEKKKPA